MTTDPFWQDQGTSELCECCGKPGKPARVACVHEHVSDLLLCQGAYDSVERGEILYLPCLERRDGHPCVLHATRR